MIVQDLKKFRVVGLNFNGQAVSQSEPIYEYLTYETDLNGVNYVLCNGKWYAINQNYLNTIDREIRTRVSRSNLALLDWTINPHRNRHEEGYYNEQYQANQIIYTLTRDYTIFKGRAV